MLKSLPKKKPFVINEDTHRVIQTPRGEFKAQEKKKMLFGLSYWKTVGIHSSRKEAHRSLKKLLLG